MSDEKRSATAAASFGEPAWDRLLLYVRVSRLPPQDGLRLVLLTMAKAAELGISDDLSEVLELLKANIEAAGFEPERTETLRSVPHYNRGAMVPADLRSASIFGFSHIGRLFLPFRKRSGDRR